MPVRGYTLSSSVQLDIAPVSAAKIKFLFTSGHVMFCVLLTRGLKSLHWVAFLSP